MKKLLLATAAVCALGIGSASAADLAARPYTKAPAPYVSPVYDWTGFYVGGHVGGGWADQGHTIRDDGTVGSGIGSFNSGHLGNDNLSGVLGGVQGGFNWQVNNVVFGIEGEYTWAGLRGSTHATSREFFPGVTDSLRTTDRIDEIATVTGRLGYAVNNWLFYGKGGWAWARGGSQGTVATNVVNVGTFPYAAFNSSGEGDGWVAGAGIEWGFAPNWSAKIEYEHIDLGSRTVQVHVIPTQTALVDTSTRIDTLKAGVNYRFNWGGPAAPHY
jgi:outer membrane immunogenic protein